MAHTDCINPESIEGRLLSECLALAKKHSEELGYSPTMDADFAADLEEIVKNRKPANRSARN